MTTVKGNTLKPRWSKVVADLWDNKLRTLLVVASIAAGVFAVGMITTAYIVMRDDLNVSYAGVEPVNVEGWTDPFGDDLVKIIGRVDGVDTVEGRRIMSVRTSRDGSEWLNLQLIGAEDFASMNINRLATIEGSRVPGRREMVVSQDFMNDTGYQVDDLIEVEFADGTIEAIPVVGLVADQATGAGDFTAGPKIYMSIETLDAFGQGDHFNRLYVTVEGPGDDEAFIESVNVLVEERVERNGLNVYRIATAVSTENPFASTILAILGVLGILGGVVTILSSSLIINTLNALLTQHTRQIGIMKLIGGRSNQIQTMYMALIFAYGVIALLVAIPAGALAGYRLASFMAFLMNANLLPFRLIPLALILQAAIAFLIPLIAGFFPVNRGARINVRQAISSDGVRGQLSGPGLIERATAVLRFISRPILLSIRNTFRQKGRLVLTIFTLTVAGALFIAVFNVRDSMENMMNMIMSHFMGDVNITFSQPYSITRVEQVVAPVPGIQKLEGWGGAAAELWDDNDDLIVGMNIVAAPNGTDLLELDLVEGRYLNPGEIRAVVVSDSIYGDFPDLELGDSLRVKIPGKSAEDWEVVGIFRFVSMLGDPLAYADFDYIASQTNLENRALSYRLVTEAHSLEAQSQVAQSLDAYLKDRGFEIRSVDAGLKLREERSQGIGVMVSFLLMMALLTAFVGSIGLAGTMGMNVLERTREIGVMRAIGAVDFEIIKSVVIEGVMIGLITWVLAVGLSFPISKLLLNIISTSMFGSTLELVYTTQGMMMWLGIVVMLSIVASILPARNAARLTIREVLSYE
jgi:putative ABC transport system permease protein